MGRKNDHLDKTLSSALIHVSPLVASRAAERDCISLIGLLGFGWSCPSDPYRGDPDDRYLDQPL
jgi:hypothetical protein